MGGGRADQMKLVKSLRKQGAVVERILGGTVIAEDPR